MTSGLRRRATTDGNNISTRGEYRNNARLLNTSLSLSKYATVILTVSIFFVVWRFSTAKINKNSIAFCHEGITSDDEQAISSCLLPNENQIPSDFEEKALVCMPTVTRNNGSIEYVSNAIKSWRLSTNKSNTIRRLAVFQMDVYSNSSVPSWIHSVFPKITELTDLPTWLLIASRQSSTVTKPRKITLGDSEARVNWRSKEALDYAEVLQRCAHLTSSNYIVIVQDDVLFTSKIKQVVPWCEQHMQDTFKLDPKTGKSKIHRVCSGSLFDLPDEINRGVDAHELDSSNMVARVWQREKVNSFHKYITTNFDEAPVDWLVDQRCKTGRRKTIVMEPNPVRHRGAVSSFEENKRQATLT